MWSFVEIANRDLAGHGEVFEGLLAGDVTAVVVKGAFDADAMARVRTHFDEGTAGVPAGRSPFYSGRTWGRILSAERDPPAYFQYGSNHARMAREVFAREGIDDPAACLARVVAAFGDGWRALAAERDGRAFVEFSVREMLSGSRIDAHFENEAFDSTGMDLVRPLLARKHQWSAYTVMGRADRGGALRVYRLEGDDPRTPAIRALPRDDQRCHEALEAACEWHDLDTDVGDLLLFDAGRHWHRVTPVEGAHARWTAGVFFAPDRDDARLVRYWT